MSFSFFFPLLSSALLFPVGSDGFRVRQIVLSDAASGIKRTIASASPQNNSCKFFWGPREASGDVSISLVNQLANMCNECLDRFYKRQNIFCIYIYITIVIAFFAHRL